MMVVFGNVYFAWISSCVIKMGELMLSHFYYSILIFIAFKCGIAQELDLKTVLIWQGC